MKTHTSLAFIAVLAGSAVVATAKDASALGPLDLEIGAKAGVGTTPSNLPSGFPNPLGFGLGARGGVAIMGIYGGANFVYYFGGSGNLPGALPSAASTSISVHSMMYGFEGGYGLTLLSLLTLRAQVGVGNFTGSSSPGTDKSNLYVEPGLTAMVTLPGLGWFAGADANVLVLPSVDQGNGQSQTETAFTFHGQIGYKF